MHSIKSLIDMVATDAVETGGARTAEQSYPSYERRNSRSDLPPINHSLRLVRDEQGRIYWED